MSRLAFAEFAWLRIEFRTKESWCIVANIFIITRYYKFKNSNEFRVQSTETRKSHTKSMG